MGRGKPLVLTTATDIQDQHCDHTNSKGGRKRRSKGKTVSCSLSLVEMTSESTDSKSPTLLSKGFFHPPAVMQTF